MQKCSACGGAVQRVITGGAGFLFKGNGFYTTDHRSEAYKKAADDDKPASAGKAKMPENESVTKPKASESSDDK